MEEEKKSDTIEDVEFGIVDEKSFVSDSLEEAQALALEYIDAKKQENTGEVIRPKIPFWREFLGVILPLLLYAAEITTFVIYRYNVWIFSALIVFTFFIFFPFFVVVTVLNYQKFAPESLRRSCRFTPSCSEYMLLAIKKYGFIKGFSKGINRLFRCHPPNGGIDEP